MKSVAPMAHRSAAGPFAPFSMSSGDMKAGVPPPPPPPPSLPAPSPESICEMPKSAIFSTPSSVSSRFWHTRT